MKERQLSLLKGPRQRGAVVRSQATEFELHCVIADTIRASLTKGWTWFHVPNGGWRPKIEAHKFERMGVKPGVPDIVLIDPSGIHYYLEIKTRYGHLSPEQKAFIDCLCAVGLHVAVAYGYEDAILWLKRWGAVRVKI